MQTKEKGRGGGGRTRRPRGMGGGGEARHADPSPWPPGREGGGDEAVYASI